MASNIQRDGWASYKLSVAATNPTTPAQLGALAIPSISAGATVAKLGITTNQNGDWYLILADTSSPQKYFSIDVSSPRSPTIATTTTPSIDTRTAMDMAVLDGAANASGAQGLRAMWKVFRFSRSEALRDAVVYEVTMKPSFETTNIPVWMNVT